MGSITEPIYEDVMGQWPQLKTYNHTSLAEDTTTRGGPNQFHADSRDSDNATGTLHAKFVYATAIFMPIGIGLATTFSPQTRMGHWIGYQILIGIGVGAGFQQARVAAQVTLPAEDLPLGVAAIFAAQFMGGAIMVLAAQNVFAQHLKSSIQALAIPGLSPSIIVANEATEIGKLVPPDRLEDVLGAYNGAITKAFQIALVVSCIMPIGALGMKWTSVKPSK